jgi:uncharacterized protein
MQKNPGAIQQIFAQYQALCKYCDDFSASIQQKYAGNIQCRKGCAECCSLETISPLEAQVISDYLEKSPASKGDNTSNSFSDTGKASPKKPSKCVFLKDDACMIYPVRPVICRTQGLPMGFSESPSIDACPLNFTNQPVSSIDKKYVLDAGKIAENLMRLNLAYCMANGEMDKAGNRINLSSL